MPTTETKTEDKPKPLGFWKKNGCWILLAAVVVLVFVLGLLIWRAPQSAPAPLMEVQQPAIVGGRKGHGRGRGHGRSGRWGARGGCGCNLPSM